MSNEVNIDLSASEISRLSDAEVRDLMERRLRAIEPGSCFTWGTRAVWRKALEVDGDVINTEGVLSTSRGEHRKSHILSNQHSRNGILVSLPGQILPQMPDWLKARLREETRNLRAGDTIRVRGAAEPHDREIRAERRNEGGEVIVFILGDDSLSGGSRKLRSSILSVTLDDRGYTVVAKDGESQVEEPDQTTLSDREAHERDIAFIFDALEYEAEERGWCHEYQQFLDKVNPRLTVPLAPKVRQYETSVTIKFDLHTSGLNEDDAEEKIHNALNALETHIAGISGAVAPSASIQIEVDTLSEY